MNRRSVNICQSRPTWLPRWNWLDGGENCLLAVASPTSAKGKGEKFYGKAGLLFLLRAHTSRTLRSRITVLYLALSFPNDAAIGRANRSGVPRRRIIPSSRVASHPLDAKRFPSRYYIRFRDESDCSWLEFTWKRKADFVWAHDIHENCEVRLSEQRYTRQQKVMFIIR